MAAYWLLLTIYIIHQIHIIFKSLKKKTTRGRLILFFNTNSKNIQIIDFIDDGNLLWPAPGIYKINSYFGKRNAPTNGASSYHKGVDIGAPEGFEFVAVTNGTITFVGFLGGGGYTITLTDGNFENGKIQYSYCHSNPNFIVREGDTVVKGQVLGKVGPKYVDSVPGNKYFDSTRKSNKWSHNWTPLTLRNENKRKLR